ncbi:50S ribosomal protein L28 [Patescibacteria group bacterium]|nr:50S ribosomal protein L28 [Patescibacteria group bacterium]
MPRECGICGKKTITGGRERRTGTRGFLKKRIKRIFKPNLRRVTVDAGDGKKKRMRICTRCLRTLKKKIREKAEK